MAEQTYKHEMNVIIDNQDLDSIRAMDNVIQGK